MIIFNLLIILFRLKTVVYLFCVIVCLLFNLFKLS